MRRRFRRCGFIAVFTLATVAGVPGQKSGETVRIEGRVTDVSGGSIMGAQVKFMGRQLYSRQTDKDGDFFFFLTPGLSKFEITAKGFCPYWGSLSLRSGQSPEQLELKLQECSECPPMDIQFEPPRIEIDGPPPPVYEPPVYVYKQEILGRASISEPKRMIMFGHRRSSGDSIVYEGVDCPQHEKLPIFIFNNGSARAERLIYLTKAHTLLGEGKVTLVYDNEIKRGDKLEIKLYAVPPLIKVEPNG